jgi:hypothetical protein
MLALLTSAVARGQDDGRSRLGDHDFVPVMALVEPFLNTHVQTTVSIGSTANAIVPVFDVTDSTVIGTAKADILLAGIGFEYQHRAKDWLAARLSLVFGGRVGTSSQTLIAEGLTGALGYDLAWLMKILRSPKVMVSGSVGLGNYSGTFVNLLDWAEGVLVGADVPLLRARNSLRGYGGAHAAWGLSRRFGLLGSFVMSYGESFDGRGTNSWNADGRLALSYDAVHDLDLPLGLALAGGRFESNTGISSKNDIWFWSVRLAHQGRDDFTIGLDFQHTYGDELRNGEKIQMNVVTIDMRYYY